ncbi:Sperm-associated antigen 6 [Acropora cervicornis]|uniref:Sperm-associated antigen 6 n=1 Tax=Acropora cervicornis TaxID=6130 RepID=A0AAD9QIU2_ACRCE|nr:Sperm-associated antigen 6 [Acropora cervicornis]
MPLKRIAASALSDICKHSPEVGIFAYSDEYVKKNVATLIREIAKHTPELAQLITNAGGVAAVVDFIKESKGNVRLPGIMMLGYVAAHSETLAWSVIVSKGAIELAAILTENEEDHIKKCVHLPALEPLLADAPPEILKYVVGQFSKVLPNDSKARRLFVTSGGLKKVQEIKAEPNSALYEYINAINNCYPEEIVR